MEIEPIHVDHSVPGAYGFLIYTSDATLAYTGDLRLHGSHAEMTMDFINKASEEDIDALISEGTRIDETRKSSEKNVYETCKKEISGTNKTIFADFNFKDVDRLRTFATLARENDRKFVIAFKEACLLKRYSEDKKLNVPALDDENIGTYADTDYKKAERKYYEGNNVWTYDEILEKQDELIIFMNFWNLGNLIDIRPKPGSLFIHSLSEAFNEEMAISEERENNWINHFKLKKIQAHCSGHASGPELKELIEKINPKVLFPIHTEHPGMFRDLSAKTRMVQEGKEYIVKYRANKPKIPIFFTIFLLLGSIVKIRDNENHARIFFRTAECSFRQNLTKSSRLSSLPFSRSSKYMVLLSGSKTNKGRSCFRRIHE